MTRCSTGASGRARHHPGQFHFILTYYRSRWIWMVCASFCFALRQVQEREAVQRWSCHYISPFSAEAALYFFIRRLKIPHP